MNKKKLLELLKPSISATNSITELEQGIKDIKINLQDANVEDVIFYKLPSTSNAIEDFNSRLKGVTPGLVVLNHGAEKLVKNDNCIFIDADQFLKVQKLILDELFPNKNKLKLVGVTGTNGKTTTVNLAVAMSAQLGHRAFSIGTIGVYDEAGSIYPDFGTTTPSYVDLRKIIFKHQDRYEACFMEVSSHSLTQGRLNDLRLDAAAWTSFSQDHLDYHQSMQEYFKAKMLIEKVYLKDDIALIVPLQEEKLYNEILKENPNIKIKKALSLKDRGFSETPLFYKSKYNQSNAEVAIELNEALWGAQKLSALDLEKIKTPSGRFSIIELGDESMVIIDYAHTPDALLNIGAAIKEAFPTHTVTTVFGCGGNRDKTKRPLMGKAVASFSDKVIVTSDNPRNEAPEDIILDIIKGISTGYEAMIDREKAIIFALEECDVNEIILIAGKGHEEYQDIKGVKHPFSDFKVVEQYILDN